jgi:hypothetical protein
MDPVPEALSPQVQPWVAARRRYHLSHAQVQMTRELGLPCVTAEELSEAPGVAKSTMGSKARQVRDLLQISLFSLEFQRADVAAQNPAVWFIEVSGLVVDARQVPLNIQVEAFERGLSLTCQR